MAAPDGRAPQLTAGAYGAVVLSALPLCQVAGEVLVGVVITALANVAVVVHGDDENG